MTSLHRGHFVPLWPGLRAALAEDAAHLSRHRLQKVCPHGLHS